MKVTLELNHEQLGSYLKVLEASEREHTQVLEEIRASIKAVKDALSPNMVVSTVKSESDPENKAYLVSERAGQYACTCESFRYHTGLDYQGNCKHIRKVVSPYKLTRAFQERTR